LGSGVGACNSKQKVEHLNRRTVERGKRLVGKNQVSKIKWQKDVLKIKNRLEDRGQIAAIGRSNLNQ